MAEFSSSRVWAKRLLFVGLCIGVMFFNLLPLSTLPSNWAGPDVLLCICFAWSLRRPDLAPIALVATVLLLADFLFQRPPGLLTLLTVLGIEYLHRRGAGLHEASFAGEWVAVSGVILGITIANHFILSISGVETAPFGLTAIQLFMTVCAYPFIAVALQVGFDIRRLAPSEADTLGAMR